MAFAWEKKWTLPHGAARRADRWVLPVQNVRLSTRKRSLRNFGVDGVSPRRPSHICLTVCCILSEHKVGSAHSNCSPV